MTHACPYTVTVGAYLLGVLCARESTEFRRHTEACPDCEREITELIPAVRLLETLKAEIRTANGHALSGSEPAAGGWDIARHAIRRVFDGYEEKRSR